MMKTYYFYKIVNDIDNEIYIGSTVDPTRRWSKHKQLTASKTMQGTVITPKMMELGNEHFSFHIIETGEYSVRQDALEREDELISEHDSINKNCASSKYAHVKKLEYGRDYKLKHHDEILQQAMEYNNRPEVKQKKSEWAKQNHKETYVKGSQSMKTKAYYAANRERLAYNSLTKWELKSFSTRKQFSVSVFQ